MITHELDFGTFLIYPDRIVGQIHEGVHLNIDRNKIIIDLVKSYFDDDTDYAYISHRIHNYSIDPMVHRVNREFLNLKCFALVDPNGLKPIAAIESKFFDQDYFQMFQSLDEAFEWVNSVLQKKSH